MPKSIITRIITGFVVSLILLFLVSWVSLGSIDALRAAGKDQLDWSMLTKELGDITPAILLAESGRRGYVPSRNPAALNMFKKGVDSVHKEIHEIVGLAAGQSSFLQRIGEIQREVDEAIITFQDSIAAFQENGDMRLQDAFLDKGLKHINAIGSSIEALTNEITKESEQREAIVDQRTIDAKRLIHIMVILALIGGVVAVFIISRDLAVKSRLEKKQAELIEQLQHALKEVKTLSGLLPICASCKKIRNDSGYWTQIEEYVTEHSEAHFSHGLCEECAARLYPDLYVPKGTREQPRSDTSPVSDPHFSSRLPGGVS